MTGTNSANRRWASAGGGHRGQAQLDENVSPANAKLYSDSVLPGDPVEIQGSTQELSSTDGDYSDWTYSWADWTKLSELNI